MAGHRTELAAYDAMVGLARRLSIDAAEGRTQSSAVAAGRTQSSAVAAGAERVA
jgi:hypothetical protein